jgi:TonB dependent receptor/TonB-dependent Receptor Plug Domain
MNVTRISRSRPGLELFLGGMLSLSLAWASPAAINPTNAVPAGTNAVAAVAKAGTNGIIRLPDVVVTGRQDNLVGVAESATQGTSGAAQLADRPILRSGEILETVPGVIITQHAGGGKANQYFLRGFNLDHGTDFAVFLDDMPLNLPSHAHGEGYADMNVVIPEFVERVDYEKGPYYADVGNYSSAGNAHLVFYQTLPQDFVTVEGGMYGYERGVFGCSQKLGPGNLLYGGEAYHDDGPWVNPDDYRKFNGLLTYSQGNAATGFSVTARGYYGIWNSSDQIPASFGATNFFGAVNPTDGGDSQRFSLQGEWHRQDENSETKVTVYGFYYYLDLFSDFTYYLTDPVKGDQFEQQDQREVAGLDAHHTLFNQWWGREVENTFGLQIRNDWINNGLYQTEDRVRVDKFDVNSGTVLPASTDVNDFTDTQLGVYYENKIQWAEKFRSVAAIRGDLDYFDVNCVNIPVNSGYSHTLLPSPKLSLIAGPWAQTEFYAQGGYSFHSNDGRGTTQTVEPTSADYPIAGTPCSKIPALVQTYGAEAGVRTAIIPELQSTLSLWWLHSDSELQQDGDTGGTTASKQASDRYGIEWANYYALAKHLSLDFDLADSIARFTSNDAADAAPGSPGGRDVPEAVGLVISSGITLHDWHGFSSSLRLRYFGPRDLTSDGIYQSSPTLLLNAEAGYQINKTWRIFVEALNLLDRHDHDIDYAYQYRVSPAASPAFGEVFHPVEPFQVRGGVTARF